MWRDGGAKARDRYLEAEVVALIERLYAHGRLPRRHNCLERSLIAYRYLSELNASPVLVMGLSHDAASGHAWVLVDDQPVGEHDPLLADLSRILAFGPGGALIS
jgi:Transglutaminase-like superfamily